MNYLISFDSFQLLENNTISDIHNTVANRLGISDWWHYLPGVYIVTTEASEHILASSIRALHPNTRFFIVGIDLRRHSGYLVKDAWDWIQNKIQRFVKLKPAPPAKKVLLSDILRKQNIPTKITNESLADAVRRISGK